MNRFIALALALTTVACIPEEPPPVEDVLVVSPPPSGPADETLLIELEEEDRRWICEAYAQPAEAYECDGDEFEVEATDVEECVEGFDDYRITCPATVLDLTLCMEAIEEEDECDFEFPPECDWAFTEDLCF